MTAPPTVESILADWEYQASERDPRDPMRNQIATEAAVIRAAIAAAEARGRPTHEQIMAALEAKRWQVNYPAYGKHGGDWTQLRDVEIACAILAMIPAPPADGGDG